MHHCQADHCLVVVDYLQRMAHSQGYAELRANVSSLTAELWELSKRLGSPVLAVSSQNRTGYAKNENKPFLETLKESGDIEYASDVILFLGEDKKRHARPPARAMQLVIAKNRHGESGSIPLIFRANIGSFAEEMPEVSDV
ncbi:MAG: DnaB-like helicase C-terminal domain-containing protein, partial [Candidatus Binatia bacterium]